MTAIQNLAVDPRPEGCKKLVGKYEHWRIRVGDWRITYTIQDDELIIVVVEVSPRGGAYRTL
jgi:mRNA interferase RelE/StbE